MTNGHKRQVQALARGLGIMQVLRDRGPSTLTEIAAKVNMDKSTVLRLLNTLSAQGFVERDPDRQVYRLGLDLILYGRRVTHDLQLRRVALPYLIRLQEISKERVGLAVLDSRKAILITVEVLESRDFPGVGLPAGVIRPFLHSTAQGKAMLAYLPERELEQIHKTIGFPRQTANTITTLEALREELHRTRERGYAFDNCENYDAWCCVGAAILGPGDQVLGALSISAPAKRLTGEAVLALIPDLKRACVDISRTMGADESVLLKLLTEGWSSKDLQAERDRVVG